MKDLLGKMVGDDGVKFSISLDMLSVTYLIAGALVTGVLLIVISKKVIN